MSSVIGIQTLGSLISVPSGCVYNEVTQEQTKEVKTIKDATGTTVQVGLLPMVTTKVTAKGKGIPPLSTVAAVSSIASGSLTTTSVSVYESNSDYPDFTLEAVSYA